MVAKNWECGTRMTLGSAMAVLVLTAIMLALPQSALRCRPSSPTTPRRTRQGHRTGRHQHLGGRFTKVKTRDGTVLANVSNLAVFDSQTEQYKPIAPTSGARGPRCGHDGVRTGPTPTC